MPHQVPIGPDHIKCPLWKKKMSEVCHKCPWWTCLRGKNPQTSADIDRWDCAIAHLPLLSIEVAQQVRQGAAATESFRNEVVARADAVRPLAPMGVEHAPSMPQPRLLGR